MRWAIPSAGLPEFVAGTVVENSFSTFPAAPVGSAPPAMPRGLRNGESGRQGPLSSGFPLVESEGRPKNNPATSRIRIYVDIYVATSLKTGLP